MIKKPYLRPTTNVVEVKIVQLLSGSQNDGNSTGPKVYSTGLDTGESLVFGYGKTTEDDALFRSNLCLRTADRVFLQLA